ncbi:Phloem protein 2-like [Dillenia turbinata]|uniref:Phloem protein 2-like n=1 Tax=Dillenia turbinata TaxID=194707 RepID=A0AAN8US64_9MAGN
MPKCQCKDLVGDTDFIEWQEAEKQFKVSPRGLNIVWGNSPQYWKLFKSMNGSEVAELIRVCWLEVVGAIENVCPGRKYQVGFRVALKPNARGWQDCTALVVAKVGESGKMIPTGLDLSQYYGKGFVDIPAEPLVVEVPEHASPSETKISFGLYEIRQGNWKSGLQIHYAFVREIGSIEQLHVGTARLPRPLPD